MAPPILIGSQAFFNQASALSSEHVNAVCACCVLGTALGMEDVTVNILPLGLQGLSRIISCAVLFTNEKTGLGGFTSPGPH